MKERGYSGSDSLYQVSARLQVDMESDPTPTRLISPSPMAYDLRPRKRKLPTPFFGGKAGARVEKVKRGGRALPSPITLGTGAAWFKITLGEEIR